MKICYLSSQNHEVKFRVYKIRRTAQIRATLWTGEQRTGAWRVAFMSAILATGNTFQEVLDNALKDALVMSALETIKQRGL